jgi:putative redox protein
MVRPLSGSVQLVDGLTFRATSGSGHTIMLDSTPESGGRDVGASPMELLLLGLAGCTGMDVISILRKMRQEVSSYEVKVRGERQDDHPRVYTTIEVEHVVRGRNLSLESIRRAIELSSGTYCSAAAMLGKSATIKDYYLIVDEETGAEVAGTHTPAGE